MRDEEDDKKMSSEKNSSQEKHWWEEEDKVYYTDRDFKAEYDWGDKTIGKIKKQLGLEEETDDDYDEEGSEKKDEDRDIKIEGDKNDNGKYYG